jgi:hypothetical protein
MLTIESTKMEAVFDTIVHPIEQLPKETNYVSATDRICGLTMQVMTVKTLPVVFAAAPTWTLHLAL